MCYKILWIAIVTGPHTNVDTRIFCPSILLTDDKVQMSLDVFTCPVQNIENHVGKKVKQ